MTTLSCSVTDVQTRGWKAVASAPTGQNKYQLIHAVRRAYPACDLVRESKQGAFTDAVKPSLIASIKHGVADLGNASANEAALEES